MLKSLIRSLAIVGTLFVVFLYLIRNVSITISGKLDRKYLEKFELFFENVTTAQNSPTDYILTTKSGYDLPNPLLLRLWLFFDNSETIQTKNWSISKSVKKCAEKSRHVPHKNNKIKTNGFR